MVNEDNGIRSCASEESKDAATGETIGYSPLTPVEHLGDIFEKARQAQEKWVAVPVAERAKMIKKISGYIADHCDDIAAVISMDNGKTRIDALAGELIPSAMAAGYYAKKAKSFLKDRFLMPGHIALANKTSKVVRVPYGVMGIISPWNYPFAIPFSEVVMGLLAGNAVILKTATETQMAGLALKKAIESAGLPENLFNYVNIPGRVAGDAFLENRVDKLFFTGSVSVGKYLMGQAARTLTPVSLELGGNDAMIVCNDADLDRAAAGAVWGGFQNSGQSCGGVERIYVESEAYDSFLEKIKQRTEMLRVGIDTDFNVDIGVMTTMRQVKLVEEHIEDALSKGAKIHARASFTEEVGLENVVMPVVLTGVDHRMRVMREETFGPVISIMKVDSIDRAVAFANDSDLGLTGSVWSCDKKKAQSIARRIMAGAITINDHLMSHGLAETPWGGFKESGIGRTHGAIGFEEMTRPQVIVTDILPFVRKNLWWYPSTRRGYNGLKGMIEVFYAGGVFKRLMGLYRMLTILPRIFKK